MRPLSSYKTISHFVLRAGAFAAATALGGSALLAASPAQAQIIGRIGQRSGSGPVAQSPQPSGGPPPVYQQPRQAYPQGRPAYPQGRPSYPSSMPVPSYPRSYPGNMSGYPQSYPGNTPGDSRSSAPVYRMGPGGSGTQMPSSSQGPYQALPPSVTYRSRTIMPGMGQDASGRSQRVYSNRFPTPVTPLQGAVQPGAVQVRRYGPVFDQRNNRSVRVTTPVGQRSLPYRDYGSNYIYSPVTIVNGPSLLGGYYYGNYSNTYFAGTPCFPSIYSCYPGFPQYIVNPGVIVISEPYYPVYATPYQPFYPPAYEVTYNQTNYYVASPDRVQQIQDGGETASQAIKNAYPEGSYQAAFADIQKAWVTGDIGLLRKHTRDTDTTLSVYFKGKYSYSIAAGDFIKITRDAFDRLSTTSFDFTRLRKAKNGDVTAYGKHVYQGSGSADASADAPSTDNTVPFSTDDSRGADSARTYDRANDPAAGAEKTIYVSYTLRKHDDQWYIIGVDSSPTSLVK